MAAHPKSNTRSPLCAPCGRPPDRRKTCPPPPRPETQTNESPRSEPKHEICPSNKRCNTTQDSPDKNISRTSAPPKSPTTKLSFSEANARAAQRKRIQQHAQPAAAALPAISPARLGAASSKRQYPPTK